MGRILNKGFRRIGDEIIDKYKDILTKDYKKNLEILSLLVEFPSKKMRNKIVGYITRKMKQLEEL